MVPAAKQDEVKFRSQE